MRGENIVPQGGAGANLARLLGEVMSEDRLVGGIEGRLRFADWENVQEDAKGREWQI